MNRLLPLAVLFAGCAPMLAVNVPVTTLQEAPTNTNVASRADTAIAVKVISYQDLDANQSLLLKMAWHEVDSAQTRGGSGAGTLVYGYVPKLPLPAFAVHVGNRSAQPLDFSNAEIALVDGKGKRYPLFEDTGALSGRVWNDAVIRYPHLTGQQQQQEQLTNVVHATPVLDKKTVIAANTDFDGYLAFKLDAREPKELEKLLVDSGKLTIEIRNVGPDQASFTVPFTMGKGQLAASCPQNKPQEIQNCEAQPLKQP